MPVFAQESFVLNIQSIPSDEKLIVDEWYYQSGDDFNRLSEFEIDQWQLVEKDDVFNLSVPDWNGIGWFKIPVVADSNLIGKPISIRFDVHNGASNLYLDNELITEIGEISVFQEDYVAKSDLQPRIIQINDTSVHYLTVRFSNLDFAKYQKQGIASGFELSFINYNTYLGELEEHEKTHSRLIIIIGLLLTLALVHLLLLIYYPSGLKNFYFIFISLGGAVFIYFDNISALTTNPLLELYSFRIKLLAWFFIMLGVLRFAYSFLRKSNPKQLYFFLIVTLIIVVDGFFQLSEMPLLQISVSILILIEFTRVIFAVKTKKSEPVDLILVGLTLYIATWLFLESPAGRFDQYFAMIGSEIPLTLFMAFISFYLLRDFAKAQTKLEYKYLEVQHLSDRSLDQERRNKEKEFQQKLLEAENERKTAELEEARALQLSMLPSVLPESKYWEFAASMQTAQEVGGDYYDIVEISDKEMMIAVGDATGHGMKAGILVATAKSYFHANIRTAGIVDTLNRISEGIRNLDLKMLYMGLMLIKTNKHTLTFTSAGMPQALLYRKSENSMEEVLLKAMPLGTNVSFPYKELSYTLEKGDMLVMVSDGLIELFNPKREQLGLEKIKEKIFETAGKSPQEIMNELHSLKENWHRKSAQEDDITILIMKAI